MSTLTADLITQPEIWKLALMPSTESGLLHAALFAPVVRQEMQWHRLTLDAVAPSPLRALEDVIYENPLLLADFAQVQAIVTPQVWTLMPPSMANESHAAEVMGILKQSGCVMSASTTPYDITYHSMGVDNAVMACVMDNDTTDFLRRTYYNVSFMPRPAMVCSYLAKEAPATGSATYLIADDDAEATLLILCDRQVVAMHSVKISNHANATYFILAMRHYLGINADAPLYIHVATAPGETVPMQDGLTLEQRLSQFCPSVARVPFPALRYRATKATINAPYPLLILPLCE